MGLLTPCVEQQTRRRLPATMGADILNSSTTLKGSAMTEISLQATLEAAAT